MTYEDVLNIISCPKKPEREHIVAGIIPFINAYPEHKEFYRETVNKPLLALFYSYFHHFGKEEPRMPKPDAETILYIMSDLKRGVLDIPGIFELTA